MRGELFVYSPEARLVAFQSAAPARDGGASASSAPAADVLVFIGGLSDGFLATPYVERLADALTGAGWALVQARRIFPHFACPLRLIHRGPQVLLSSSYGGWGTASLSRDADELAALVAHLRAERGAVRVALMGHSTGCQDIVALLRRGDAAARVNAVVLQAPVSDRDYLATLPDTAARLAAAQAMLADGRGEQLLPLAHDGARTQQTPAPAALSVQCDASGL